MYQPVIVSFASLYFQQNDIEAGHQHLQSARPQYSMQLLVLLCPFFKAWGQQDDAAAGALRAISLSPSPQVGLNVKGI
ncbi:MAG: hypothetical protein R3B47_19915 [Bacteroidia bacterium]